MSAWKGDLFPQASLRQDCLRLYDSLPDLHSPVGTERKADVPLWFDTHAPVEWRPSCLSTFKSARTKIDPRKILLQTS